MRLTVTRNARGHYTVTATHAGYTATATHPRRFVATLEALSHLTILTPLADSHPELMGAWYRP